MIYITVKVKVILKINEKCDVSFYSLKQTTPKWFWCACNLHKYFQGKGSVFKEPDLYNIRSIYVRPLPPMAPG